MLKSARLWTAAAPAQLNDEIDRMIAERANYKPEIRFETPKPLQEAAEALKLWKPTVEEDNAQVADQAGAPSSEPDAEADNCRS